MGIIMDLNVRLAKMTKAEDTAFYRQSYNDI